MMFKYGFPTYWTTLKKFIWLYGIELKNKFKKLIVSGLPPLTLSNAVLSKIISLTQYGKCEQDGTPTSGNPIDIKCNNGALRIVNNNLQTIGTPEVITVTHADSTTQTASVEDLFAVGSIKDEQDIISGTIKHRCEAIIYDGTQTVTEPYLSSTGGKDNGAIIVHPKGTNYSGDIASFDFDEEDNELGGIVCNIEPVQDLHGYDNPWPPGGGKNKLNLSRTVGTPASTGLLVSPREMATDKYYAGLRCDNYYYPNYIQSHDVSGTSVKVTTLNNTRYGVALPVEVSDNTQYTLSATLSGAMLSVGAYDSVWNFLSEVMSPKGAGDVPFSFTTPSNTAYLTIIVSSSVLGTEGTATNIQLEAGSTATSFAPFENICPISGFTGVNVYGTGKNLLDSSVVSSGSGGFVFFNNNRDRYHKTITLAAGQYTFSVSYSADFSSTKAHLNVYDVATDTRLAVAYSATKVTFTLSAVTDICLLVQQSGLTIADILTAQLERNDTATAYSAFSGTTIPVSWQSEAGTVYAGYCSIDKDGNVTLTGTHKKKTPPKSDIRRNAAYQFYAIPDSEIATGEEVPCISDKFRAWNGTESLYKHEYMCFVNSGGAIRFNTSVDYATVDDYWTAVGETSFLCQLATPVTYTLSSVTVPSTVQNENNWWCDTGEISVLVLEPTTESVTPQPLNTTKGTNVVEVEAEVDGIELEVVYKGRN